VSRSSTMQFAWLTEEEAARLLRTLPKTAESHGDRLVAQQCVEFFRRSREERLTERLTAAHQETTDDR
jgi:hypothetical protein